jgi:hypothetical protein
MPRVIHRRQFDPWYPVDWTGFNKVGYVTENDVVIYPRRSCIVREPLAAVRKYKHRILTLNHPRAKEVEIFVTSKHQDVRLRASIYGATGSALLGSPNKAANFKPDHAFRTRNEVEYSLRHVTARGRHIHIRH